ncbi:MAG: hypothetical protein LBU48_04890 [Coriobacteriales bacterium]|jgi:hypothetical protein|nr:hypothetical protein [Coriobacteriales bacterium]
MDIKRGMAIFLGTFVTGLIIPALAFATATGNGMNGVFKLDLAIMAAVAIAVLALAAWIIALTQVRRLANGICQNKDCAFNPLRAKAGFAFDYASLQTPKEFTTGAFAPQPEPQPAPRQVLVAQQFGPPVDPPVIEHESETMEFTLGMVRDVLEKLQQAEQIVPQPTAQDQPAAAPLVPTPPFVAKADEPVALSGTTQHEKQEYRGAHFKPAALAGQDEGDEPVLWALPPMKHARVEPRLYEKAV